MNIAKISSKAAMLVVMFAVVLTFNACSNDNTDDGNQSGNQSGSSSSSQDDSSSGSQDDSSSSSQGDSSSSNQGGGTPITKLELPETMQAVIGYGYDASGRYAYSPDIKEPILDQNALLAASRIVKDVNMVFGKFETITGSDINQYRRELAGKVSTNSKGGYGSLAFEAEMSGSFGETKIQNTFLPPLPLT